MRASLLIALLSLGSTLAAPTRALAVPQSLQPGTRPWWAAFSLGPAITMYSEDWVAGPDQLKISQSIGYHFLGNSAGPALSFELQESFGDSWVALELGPQFCWDFQLVPALALYLSPSFMFGLAAAFPSGNYWGIDNGVGITAQFGLALKLILFDRLLLQFRPLTFDLAGVKGGNWFEWLTFLRYDMVFSAGVTF